MIIVTCSVHLNLVLSIVTFGIYIFWAKVRFRKYSTSSFSLLGDRLEYTGTGGELFKGFIKAFLFLLIIMLFYTISSQLIATIFGIDKNIVQDLISTALLALYIFIYFASTYLIIRYRYSRTTWRGIRGSLSGSAKHFAILSVYRIFLNIISFGYLIPHSQLKTKGYIINNSYFGNAKAEFVGTEKSLIKINIITLFLLIPTLGIARLWYFSALTKYIFTNTQIASARMVVKYTGGKLFILFITNLLILIFTLGLGFPVIIWRNFRFFAQNVAIIGNIDVSTIEQSRNGGNSFGEGINDVADMGINLI